MIGLGLGRLRPSGAGFGGFGFSGFGFGSGLAMVSLLQLAGQGRSGLSCGSDCSLILPGAGLHLGMFVPKSAQLWRGKSYAFFAYRLWFAFRRPRAHIPLMNGNVRNMESIGR